MYDDNAAFRVQPNCSEQQVNLLLTMTSNAYQCCSARKLQTVVSADTQFRNLDFGLATLLFHDGSRFTLVKRSFVMLVIVSVQFGWRQGFAMCGPQQSCHDWSQTNARFGI